MKAKAALIVKQSPKINLLIFILFVVLSCGKFHKERHILSPDEINKKIDSLFKLDVSFSSQIKLIDLSPVGLPISGKIYDFFEKDIVNHLEYDFDGKIYTEYLISKFGDTIIKTKSKYLFDLRTIKRVDNVDAYFDFLKNMDYEEGFHLKSRDTSNLKTIVIMENGKQLYKIDLFLANNILVREDFYYKDSIEEQTFYNHNGYIDKRVQKIYDPDVVFFYLYE